MSTNNKIADEEFYLNIKYQIGKINDLFFVGYEFDEKVKIVGILFPKKLNDLLGDKKWHNLI